MKTRIRNLVAFTVLALSISTLASAPANANGVGVCGPENFASGNGSQNSPFLVNNANSLSELRDCALAGRYWYRQTQDIALNGLWTPIAYFTGTYDGAGYEISGLDIQSNSGSAGLFAYTIYAEISNLEISGSVTNMDQNTGLLAGEIESSTIQDVTAFVDVSGARNTGGLIGSAIQSEISAVTVQALSLTDKVSSDSSNVGGVVGYLLNSDIDNTIAIIDVSSDGWNEGLGGIYGLSYYDGGDAFEHSYLTFSGSIQNLADGAYRCGGIAGQTDYLITHADVFDTGIICESHDVGGVAGRSTATVNYSKVDAEIKIDSVDYYEQAAAVGGIIGNWGPTEGFEQTTGNSAHVNLSAEWIVGGIIGIVDTTTTASSETIEINDAAVYGEYSDSYYAGGILGLVVDFTEGGRASYPALAINESYAAVDYAENIEISDAVVLSDIPVTISNVVWNSTGINAESSWEESLSASLASMSRPGFWKRFGWNMDTKWGMSTQFFNGLPVLRAQNEVEFNIACQVKSFPHINFGNNSSKLSNSAKAKLRNYANEIIAGYCSSISVYGFASGKEKLKKKSKVASQNLISYQRATKVLAYLHTFFDETDMVFYHDLLGAGARNKLNKDKTSKQQAANRRVVIATVS